MSNTSEKMGVSGRLAAAFQSNAITPLLALVALLLGLFAVLVTPREEEPQINVTMANVLIPFPGASSQTVQNMVARPAEQVLGQIQGIEHTTSVARPGVAVLTVQFKVGVPRTEALVRLYDVLNANQDWLPRDLGTLAPIVKPKGIDDVPVLGVTLWSPDASSAHELERVAVGDRRPRVVVVAVAHLGARELVELGQLALEPGQAVVLVGHRLSHRQRASRARVHRQAECSTGGEGCNRHGVGIRGELLYSAYKRRASESRYQLGAW